MDWGSNPESISDFASAAGEDGGSLAGAGARIGSVAVFLSTAAFSIAMDTVTVMASAAGLTDELDGCMIPRIGLE
jgi:hypothetical protein